MENKYYTTTILDKLPKECFENNVVHRMLNILNMKKEIKELRVKIDGLAQLTKSLTITSYIFGSTDLKNIDAKELLATFEKYGRDVQPISTPEFTKVVETSKEIEKAHDSLILAKAWLGKVLGELGTESPYANDGNRKTVEDIEPAADKGHIIVFEDFNHIQKIDWLRQEIEKCIDLLPWEILQKSNIEVQVTNCYTYLSEARFWLGFELQRIKENGTT